MGEEKKRSRLHNNLKDFLIEVNGHKTVALTYARAQEILVRVGEVWADFNVVQEKLEATCADDAAFKVQEKVADEVEKTFSDVRGKLRVLVEELKPSRAAPTTPSTSLVKLPKTDLKKFDGNLTSWIPYRDIFQNTVIKRSDISGAQKLQYLKNSLDGEPLNLIDYMETTDANFAEAWKILEARYHNKRELIRAHTYKIIDLKPVKYENAGTIQAMKDDCVSCVRSLNVLGSPTDEWDHLLVALLEKKLDPATRREWAKSYTSTDPPKFEEITTFIDTYVRGLQVAGPSYSGVPSDRKTEKQFRVNHAAADGDSCQICQGAHQIKDCEDFLAISPKDRSTMAKNCRLCFNCLKPDHMIRSCPSNRKCKKCGLKHHTLLHEERNNEKKQDNARDKPPSVSGNHVAAESPGVVMTAIVLVADTYGVKQPCRAFIDPGAQADFISEACISRLGLSRESSKLKVTGFGDTKVGTSRGKVRVTLLSRIRMESIEVELHIMSTLTGRLPSVKCRNSSWRHLQGLELADNKWYQPGGIDILLGVKYFNKLMRTQRVAGPTDDAPFAWETMFGWVVAGSCPEDEGTQVTSFHVGIDRFDEQLQKFWEIEEPPRKRILTKEEKACEHHFKSTYTRLEGGRFMVAVPFDEIKKKTLGASKQIALRRLQQVERRLAKNPQLQEQYTDFMREYETLGHMTKVPPEVCGEVVGSTNFLCHHFVVNESSTTTKLRVVFDGSAPTTTGVSLNSTMMVGATLQDDLYDLLLRFRVHAIVLKADIAKMFRQFRMKKEDADLHRILWRENQQEPVQEYRLETITYGTACAPNLSTRCIQQLGIDCALDYPQASKVLINDAYIDDILTGKENEEEAIHLYNELCKAVSTAGLELRKWTSNMRETEQLVFDDDELVKALGVQWQPTSDTFKFKVPKFSEGGKASKRTLLSDLAKIFDPLGLISCVTLKGKLLLQELWKLPLEWDEQIPDGIHQRWEEYKQDVAAFINLSVPRRIGVSGCARLEICGFSDSSEIAYGGNIYLRSIYPNGNVEVRFVTSKTRVAPVRQVTLPRLELCAAVLIAELVVHVVECLKLENVEIYLWSDSTITLTWIAASPRRWKTYIANRVATIQELTPISNWRHVAGSENPADLASRVCSVEELCTADFWWRGPQWLSQPTLPEFPKPTTADPDPEERKLEVIINAVKVAEHPVLQRFSSLIRLQRVTAWYLRFIIFRSRKKCRQGPLTPTELNAALILWVRKTTASFQRGRFKIEEGWASRSKEQVEGTVPICRQQWISSSLWAIKECCTIRKEKASTDSSWRMPPYKIID